MSAQDTHVTVPNGHRMRARWFLPERPNGLNAAVVVIHDIFGFKLPNCKHAPSPSLELCMHQMCAFAHA